MLLIYIDEKISLFILSTDEILVQKTFNFFALEEDRMTSMGSNFLCGRPHGAETTSPRPLASTWAWPLTLRVDVAWVARKRCSNSMQL